MQYVSNHYPLQNTKDWAKIQPMKTFGQNLKALRESRKLSQEELAKMLGYARENLNAIENDRRACPKHLYGMLSSALGTPETVFYAWRAIDEYGLDVLSEMVKQVENEI